MIIQCNDSKFREFLNVNIPDGTDCYLHITCNYCGKKIETHSSSWLETIKKHTCK